MVGAGDRVLFVQNGVNGAGDGLAVVDVHAAVLVNIQPQEIFAALPDVFHVPKLAAVFFHDGLGEGRHLFGNFHGYTLSLSLSERWLSPALRHDLNQQEREALAPLFPTFYLFTLGLYHCFSCLARGFSQIPGLFFNILPNQRWKTPLKESTSDDTILKNNFPEYATFSASHTFYWQKYF